MVLHVFITLFYESTILLFHLILWLTSIILYIARPSRFGSVVAHLDLDWEVLGSSPGHTKDFKNGTYCSSASAGYNELE